jgi:hypothetical protein
MCVNIEKKSNDIGLAQMIIDYALAKQINLTCTNKKKVKIRPITEQLNLRKKTIMHVLI